MAESVKVSGRVGRNRSPVNLPRIVQTDFCLVKEWRRRAAVAGATEAIGSTTNRHGNLPFRRMPSDRFWTGTGRFADLLQVQTSMKLRSAKAGLCRHDALIPARTAQVTNLIRCRLRVHASSPTEDSHSSLLHPATRGDDMESRRHSSPRILSDARRLAPFPACSAIGTGHRFLRVLFHLPYRCGRKRTALSDTDVRKQEESSA
jgi:hypothetical protein